MCIICVDLAKDALTIKEARNNLKELSSEIGKEHYVEVLHLIWQKEDEEYDIYYCSGSD